MGNPELLADKDGPYCMLSAKEAFDGLNKDERTYAYHMLRAGFHGTRILLRQTSSESEAIFDIFMSLYDKAAGDWTSILDLSGVTKDELDAFLEYGAMVLANFGNYRSQGDRKFIPRLSPSAFEKICGVADRSQHLYKRWGQLVFAESPDMFGFPCDGYQSGYYPLSSDITKEDIEAVQQIAHKHDIQVFNTRLQKFTAPGEHNTRFDILVAAAEESSSKELSDSTVRLVFGDHRDCIVKIISALEKASGFTANDIQHAMLMKLVQSLKTGDTEAFKQYQELWVKDKGPVIETSHGFIESYQDPQGVRCSWQGFVGVTCKSQVEMYASLVNRAPEFMYVLPWNLSSNSVLSPYENPVFKRPDFTNLDVLGFCCSEMWSGINLPNFEDICQNHGFKNLTLGNVNNNRTLDKFVPFIKDSELEFFRKHRARAFEVMVACHELLGHGSGRLFLETEPGKYNFDIENPPESLLTGSPIDSCYRVGETWQSVFGKDAGSYEECRADGVALLLVSHKPILEIFGYTNATDIKSEDITYGGWLQFVQGALKGLSQWNSETNKWGQAHKRGQYAILRMLLEDTHDLLELENTGNNLIVHLNRDRIVSDGVPALEHFLKTLQVYKSTADVKGGRPFFDRYSEMTDDFRKHRNVSMNIKPNRTQWIQPNLFLNNDGTIELKEYPATKEALVQSWAERNV
ncbi:peptidase family M49 [Pleomassaria siparia CBS 279.74]|uniref:Dipeptidyl peptidase 3 n=1 Tax=Pleomassaria siparia CBS 279.74 TaxID=1314801 RepID=A0A6G1JRA9_9PLEO|nr:peptidase family M49 [Pleomassaria siparia CBS 279.74]